MSRRRRNRPHTRTRRAARLVVAAALAALVAPVTAPPVLAQRPTTPAAAVLPASATSTSNGDAVVRTRSVSRDHLVDGVDTPVEQRTVTVSVNDTTQLRDRDAVTVSWRGAHPTGGIVVDKNDGPKASQQEYPVVIMQCRGVDSTAVPVSQRIRPETCWTQTPSERYQYSLSGNVFPAYRLDRYATTADRAVTVGQPTPLPAGCAALAAAHWLPFIAADGTRYDGGSGGCAGMPPEAAADSDSLQPASTTYAATDADGRGSAKFVMQSADSNASLGCSDTVKCSLVVIPVMGISCDVAGTADGPGLGMAPGTRPSPVLRPLLQRQCGQRGHFAAGALNPNASETPDLPVTGQLWWSASNWRNRITVPLGFARSAAACDSVGNTTSVYAYGSEALAQATAQWSPHFCLDPKLYTLRHVQTSEPQAKNLLDTGSIEAAIQAGPPAVPFREPVVQAPAALSAFAVVATVDDARGNPARIRLNARLLAKLLSESYRSCATCLDFTTKEARYSGFARMSANPIDMSRDPEFQALNPGIPVSNYLQAAATIEVMSSDSDLMTALTSYLNADPEAREFLNGYPDPWGMTVNQAYKGIALPVSSWPLLDTHLAVLPTGANLCLVANPAPWLPLVAAPVSNPATVALHMQFDISNSQTTCKDNGAATQRLVANGRQNAGQRFLIGLVSLADAARYQLNTAELQTTRKGDGDGDGQFDDASGRTFVAPTDASLRAAGALLEPDDAMGTWPVPYSAFRRSAAAYPGTVLMSIDVPTKGLSRTEATRYGQLLRFVAGRGQVRGDDAGDLPPGYLPLSGALGPLADYTAKAAAAVADQTGEVPFVSGKAGAGKPTKGAGQVPTRAPGAAPVVTPRTAGGAPTTGVAPAAPASRVPTSRAPATSAPAPSVPAGQPAAAPVGKTTALGPGVFGNILPILLVLALLSLGVAVYSGGIGRKAFRR